MKLKIGGLLLLLFGLISCDDVDTEQLLGITEDTVVTTTVEQSEEVVLYDQVWEKSYVIDIDKDYPDYAKDIKNIDFKAFLYEVKTFENSGSIKGGNVDVYLSDQEPERKRHDSFENDIKNKTVYKIDNPAKIQYVKNKLVKERKATFLFKVTLDEKPIVPLKIGFKFDFDMELSGINVKNIK